MDRNTGGMILVSFAATVILVTGLSAFSAALWGGVEEKIMDIPELVIEPGMTPAGFVKTNRLAGSS